MEDRRSKVTVGFIRDQRGLVTIQVFGTVYCNRMERVISGTFHLQEIDQVVAQVIPAFMLNGVIENVEMADLGYDMCDGLMQ